MPLATRPHVAMPSSKLRNKRGEQSEPRAFAERLMMVVGNASRLVKETGEKPEGWPALVEAVGVLEEIRKAEEG